MPYQVSIARDRLVAFASFTTKALLVVHGSGTPMSEVNTGP